MSTRGLNKFEKNVVDALNLIFQNGGKTLIEELLNKQIIKYHIIPAGDDREGIGGYIKERDLESQDVMVYIYTNNGTETMTLSIAHELMHCFQNQMGQGGRSIHNEVEAFIFQNIMAFNLMEATDNWNYQPEYNGKDGIIGYIYSKIMGNITSNGSNIIKFVIALFTFRYGASINNGVYDNYPLSNDGSNKYLLDLILK